MNGIRGVSLRGLNTLGVAARAGRLVELEHVEQLETTRFDPERDLVLGGGSNVLLAGDMPGAVLLNRLRGRAVCAEDGDTVQVRVGAGEPWHEFVRWTVRQGFSGLENLSLIPGLCGAAPIQNIGAYGVELAETVHTVEAWDWERRATRHFDRADCAFAYRDSRFKSGEPDRYLVTALVLTLDRGFQPRLDYSGLREELEALGRDHPTARDVSDAVIRIRRRKLPDPAVIGNAGSFFKNPILNEAMAQRLREQEPDLPLHPAGRDTWKTSAAWLIERCGWKGHREGDAGISAQHALVLVNHGEATGAQLVDLARRVRASVKERYGVMLENEPRIVGGP